MTRVLRSHLLAGVTMALATGCARLGTTTAPDDESTPTLAAPGTHGAEALGLPDVTPTYVEGQPLSARIPGLDGSSLDLGQLAGRIVVVAFVDPTTPALAEHLTQHYDAAQPSGAVLVLVAMEGMTPLEFSGLEAWLGRTDVFVGWDPQGALAIKLRIKNLPFTLVLARDGRVAAVLDPVDGRGLAQAIGEASGAATDDAAPATTQATRTRAPATAAESSR